MYLVVKFFDNDFGYPMLGALTRLWEYIHTNNAHLTGPDRPRSAHRSGLTLTQLYQSLHECGALESLILRLFVLERLCQDVEHKTRGLTWADVDWAEHVVKEPSHLTDDTYLSVEVDIYGEYETIPDIEWANGECAFLNLDDGTIGIF
jgi:hypothetical protein